MTVKRRGSVIRMPIDGHYLIFQVDVLDITTQNKRDKALAFAIDHKNVGSPCFEQTYDDT